MTVPFRRNPRGRELALSAAFHMADRGIVVPSNQCDHLAAVVFGWAHSGEKDALAHWLSLTGFHHKDEGSKGPFWGALFADLLFWDIPGSPFGHVAVRARERGFCYSPDITNNHRYSRVQIGDIARKWGGIPLGYTRPYFPHGAR